MSCLKNEEIVIRPGATETATKRCVIFQNLSCSPSVSVRSGSGWRCIAPICGWRPQIWKPASRIGHEVGEIARRLYDPNGSGVVVDAQAEGFGPALARSAALLDSSAPIFEAGFAAEGALAFADIMLPVGNDPKPSWRMVEVKSSASVKDYHREDIAIQAFVALAAGVPLKSIALAHIDSGWLYPGDDNYQGLLVETRSY